ncbi:MAG: carboxypeptidase-like regulatory domain-containing protein, partial [Candidatus Thermoplasmatota archaeon]
EFEVEEGEKKEINVELKPIINETVILKGKVIDALTGEGIAKAIVSLYRHSDGNGTFDNLKCGRCIELYEAYTDENGDFKIELRAGTYTMVVEAEGYESQKQEIEIWENMEITIKLQPIFYEDKEG